MSSAAGVFRKAEELENALFLVKEFLREAEEIYTNCRITPETVELRNIAYVACFILNSALHRKESRGVHYLEGHERDDQDFFKDTILMKGIKCEAAH